MARTPAFKPRNHWRAGKFQITNGIENLVPHELILEPLLFGIADTVAVNHEGVIQVGTAGVTGSAQFLRLMEKSKRPRGCNLPPERIFAQRELKCLVPDGRVGEVDL